MSPEWVTALATAGTFVVLAASAVAAFTQLRTRCRNGSNTEPRPEARVSVDG